VVDQSASEEMVGREKLRPNLAGCRCILPGAATWFQGSCTQSILRSTIGIYIIADVA
jgi:hypothetical protein